MCGCVLISMDGSAGADATQTEKEKPRELHPHEPEYSDVGFLSKDEMAERRLRRKELESEKSTRLSQNRIGERERLKSESQLEARRVRLRFLALTDGPRPPESALCVQLRQKSVRHRKRVLEENRRKSAKSPFQIDLVAETERIDEEVLVRLKFEEQVTLADSKRKERVMDEVIRSALTEEDHVSRLRAEKVKLLVEQKRLKALRDMQKADSNLQRKQDMLVPGTLSSSAAAVALMSRCLKQAERTRQRRLQAELAKEKRAQVVARQAAEKQRKFEALKYRHGVEPSRDIAV